MNYLDYSDISFPELNNKYVAEFFGF